MCILLAGSAAAAAANGTRIVALRRADGTQLLCYQNEMMNLQEEAASSSIPALLLILPLADKERGLLGVGTTDDGSAFEMVSDLWPRSRSLRSPQVFKTKHADVISLGDGWASYGAFVAAIRSYDLDMDEVLHGKLVEYYTVTVPAELRAQGLLGASRLRWTAVAFRPTSSKLQGACVAFRPPANMVFVPMLDSHVRAHLPSSPTWNHRLVVATQSGDLLEGLLVPAEGDDGGDTAAAGRLLGRPLPLRLDAWAYTDAERPMLGPDWVRRFSEQLLASAGSTGFSSATSPDRKEESFLATPLFDHTSWSWPAAKAFAAKPKGGYGTNGDFFFFASTAAERQEALRKRQLRSCRRSARSSSPKEQSFRQF